jgi:hypothetical protein
MQEQNQMKKNILLFSVVLIILTSIASPAFAGWLIFHEPKYKGSIIDAETKEPIEGVVIVAMYYVHPIISGPAGGSARIIHIKETLTDAKGDFIIPSYTTLTSPNSFEIDTEFIIYKGGYASYPDNSSKIYPFQYCGPGYLFLEEKSGMQEEFKKDSEVVKVTMGVAELGRLSTINERNMAIPSRPTDWEKKVPILNSLLKGEDEYLYGKEK